MSRPSGEGAKRSIWSIFLLGVLAVGLLAGPLWVDVAHLDDRVYEYERVEVTAQGGTVAYVPEAEDPGVQISEDIACSGAIVSRTCYLERSLIGNSTVPTSRYSSSVSPVESAYHYVAGSNATYQVETVLDQSQGYIVENQSLEPVDEDSYPEDRVLYRVHLTLERLSPHTVLDRVSVDVEHVDQPIRQAARTGSSRTSRQVDTQESPVKLDDGSIYRVYLAAEHGPPENARSAVVLLRYVAPIGGLIIGYSVLMGVLKDQGENP